MKIRYIILGFIVFSWFLIGCSSPADKVEDKSPVLCEKPFTIVGEDCCLDNNANKLCDKSETVNNEVKLLQGMPVSEKCEGGVNLDCVGHNIAPETISIKLQSVTKDLINVKKIKLPGLGCEQEFQSAAEMRFNDAQEFKIPCIQRYNTVDSEIIIVMNARNVKVKSSGEIYDISTPTEIENRGRLSGAVKY